jgi:hypothetical protein
MTRIPGILLAVALLAGGIVLLRYVQTDQGEPEAELPDPELTQPAPEHPDAAGDRVDVPDALRPPLGAEVALAGGGLSGTQVVVEVVDSAGARCRIGDTAATPLKLVVLLTLERAETLEVTGSPHVTTGSGDVLLASTVAMVSSGPNAYSHEFSIDVPEMEVFSSAGREQLVVRLEGQRRVHLT